MYSSEGSLVQYHSVACACTSEEKNDDSRDSFSRELEQIFDYFPKQPT